MKIEDINYTLPTNEIAEENFDKEKWLKENPIDYFKLIYNLFTITETVPTNLPRNIKMKVVYEALYSVIRLYIPDTLYKFYSLNDNRKSNQKKFMTLQNRQIFMSNIKDFNDPFDGKASFYDSKQLSDIKYMKHINGRIIDDFTTLYRGTALTENNTSCMPMWAHYSNNHQGFCVAYDMKNPDNSALAACTFPVQYTDERLDITSYMRKYSSTISSEIDKQIVCEKKQIEIDISLIYMQLYLCNIKHLSWNYEKEFRCTTAAQAKGMPYIDATPKAIYIGMKCSPKNRKRLIAISKELSIPVYQMKLDELSENYTLEEKLLDA